MLHSTTRRIAVAALGLALAGLCAGRAEAGLITTYEIRDIGGFPDQQAANTGQTYQGTGFLGMYTWGNFVDRFALDWIVARTALQVDISSLAGAQILGAILTFDLKDGEDGTQAVTVTSYASDGNLGFLYSAPAGLGAADYQVTGKASNSLDVTSFVRERVDAGAGWLGLHLQGYTHNHWTFTHASGGYSPDNANVRLAVEYAVAAVPEPATLISGGLAALIGLGHAWRRRRAMAVADRGVKASPRPPFADAPRTRG